MVPPTRRAFLGGCAAVATGMLAGCVDPDVAMSVEEVRNDEAIARQATYEPRERADEPSIMADAVDGGVETTDGRGFDPDRPVSYEGAVYDLERTVVGQESRTEYAITPQPADENASADIDFDDLPEIDQDALGQYQVYLEANDGTPDEDRPRMTIQKHYPEEDRDVSMLVPEPEVETIRIMETVVEVDVEERTEQIDVYRFETTERAASLSAFGSRIRTAHAFELTDLSEAEREFFESTIEEGSYYDTEPGSGFQGIADRLVEQPAIYVHSTEGEWLVEYGGDHYWVEVDFVRMEEYADRLTAVDEVGDGPANGES